MDVILINRAGENLNVKQKLANHSSSEVLCSLKPNDKCSVTTDFIVLGSGAAGDSFDSWWGDDSYKQARVTLAVTQDPKTKGYLVYTKV